MNEPTATIRAPRRAALMLALAVLLPAVAGAQAGTPAPAQSAGPAGTLAPAAAVVGAKLARKASAARKEPTTGRVVGRLVDAVTGEVLIGGQVAVQGLPLGNVSDDAGAYFVNNVPAGPQTFAVEYLGYEARSIELDVKAGVENTLDVALSPTPIAIEEIVVEEEVVRSLDEYVDKTPPPALVSASLRPVDVLESDTTAMEEWHRSMRELTVIHSIEYPMAGMRVYYRRSAPKRPSEPATAAGDEEPPAVPGRPE